MVWKYLYVRIKVSTRTHAHTHANKFTHTRLRNEHNKRTDTNFIESVLVTMTPFLKLRPPVVVVSQTTYEENLILVQYHWVQSYQ